MLKKILTGIGILCGLIALTGIFGFYYFKPSADSILDFLKNNPDRTSILLLRNDSTMASRNTDKVMTLASTVKIIVAIEYAAQAATGKVNPDERISIKDLRKFYAPLTDGGAHPLWLESMKSKITDNTVSLREVAKGMLSHSSNANTEYLLDRLGLDNVNAQVQKLGLKHHTPVFYFVSSLYVGKEAFPGIKGAELKDKVLALDHQKYLDYTNIIHGKLLTDTTYRKDFGELNIDMQHIWSDNLPASSVSDYVSIMKKINNRNYFDVKTQTYLDEVIEYILDNPANRTWLEHSGMKGGNTGSVLTKSLYATDKEGNKTELAYFMNDLSFFEMNTLRMSMNEFELKILTDKVFREKVQSLLQ